MSPHVSTSSMDASFSIKATDIDGLTFHGLCPSYPSLLALCLVEGYGEGGT